MCWICCHATCCDSVFASKPSGSQGLRMWERERRGSALHKCLTAAVLVPPFTWASETWDNMLLIQSRYPSGTGLGADILNKSVGGVSWAETAAFSAWWPPDDPVICYTPSASSAVFPAIKTVMSPSLQIDSENSSIYNCENTSSYLI